MKLVLFTVFLLIFIACNNSESSNTTVHTKSDSLMEEVLKSHDTAMAKMGKLNEAKTRIQNVIDSIAKLPTALQKNSMPYKMQLNSAFNRLAFANYGMEKWMNEFNMDTLKNNKDELDKYLESEKLKISRVNEIMRNSLQDADALLKK